MIKKITPLIFLFSTIFGSNGTLSQAFTTIENIYVKNPISTSIATSIVAGAGASILLKLNEKLHKNFATNLIAKGAQMIGFFALLLTIPFTVCGPLAWNISEHIAHGIPKKTAAILPLISIPLYFVSLFGTFCILNKLG
jgi:hypothetical protein